MLAGGEHQIRLLTKVARQTQAAPEYERWILQASPGGGQPIDGFFDVKPAWVVSSVDSLWRKLCADRFRSYLKI